MKPMSIDEAARKLRAEWSGRDWWSNCPEDYRDIWRRVARLARKLFAPPADKKPNPMVCEACGKSKRSVRRRTTCDGKRFNSCKRCWCHIPADVFDRKVAANRAKARAAKKARR